MLHYIIMWKYIKIYFINVIKNHLSRLQNSLNNENNLFHYIRFSSTNKQIWYITKGCNHKIMIYTLFFNVLFKDDGLIL